MDKQDQQLLAFWAADCAERVLPLFESKSKELNLESLKPALSQLATIDNKKERYFQAIAKYNQLIKLENQCNTPLLLDQKVVLLS
jgi:hypothetical protein